MSRKDYQAFARILGEHLYGLRRVNEKTTDDRLIPFFTALKDRFEAYLSEENPAFDAERFDTAIHKWAYALAQPDRPPIFEDDPRLEEQA